MFRMKKGFTLSEIMVVVIVIGILTAFGLPMYNKVIERTRAANAATMLNSLSTSYTIARNAMGRAPATTNAFYVSFGPEIAFAACSAVTGTPAPAGDCYTGKGFEIYYTTENDGMIVARRVDGNGYRNYHLVWRWDTKRTYCIAYQPNTDEGDYADQICRTMSVEVPDDYAGCASAETVNSGGSATHYCYAL